MRASSALRSTLLLLGVVLALVAGDLPLPPAPPQPAWWAAATPQPEPWSLTDFQVLGPFPYPNSDLLRSIIGPETGYQPTASYPTTGGKTIGWQARPAWGHGDLISLSHDLGQEAFQVAFIACRIDVRERTQVNLLIRSDDQSACWIDGKQTLLITGGEGKIGNWGATDLWLEPGAHRLVLKVFQFVREWDTIIALSETDDAAIRGRIRWLEERLARTDQPLAERRRAAYRVAQLYERIGERGWAIHRWMTTLALAERPLPEELLWVGGQLDHLAPPDAAGDGVGFEDIAWLFARHQAMIRDDAQVRFDFTSPINVLAWTAAAAGKADPQRVERGLAAIQAADLVPLLARYDDTNRVLTTMETLGRGGGERFLVDLLARACQQPSIAGRAAILLGQRALREHRAGEAIAYALASLGLAQHWEDVEAALDVLQRACAERGVDPTALLTFLHVYRAGAADVVDSAGHLQADAPALLNGALAQRTATDVESIRARSSLYLILRRYAEAERELSTALASTQASAIRNALAADLEQVRRTARFPIPASDLADDPMRACAAIDRVRLALMPAVKPEAAEEFCAQMLEEPGDPTPAARYLGQLVLKDRPGESIAYELAALRIARHWEDVEAALDVLQRASKAHGNDPALLLAFLRAYRVGAPEVADAAAQLRPTTPARVKEREARLVERTDPGSRQSYAVLGFLLRRFDAVEQDLTAALAAATEPVTRALLTAHLDQARRAARFALPADDAADDPVRACMAIDRTRLLLLPGVKSAVAQGFCLQMLQEPGMDRKAVLEAMVRTFTDANDGSRGRAAAIRRMLTWLETQAPVAANPLLLDVARLLDQEGEHRQALAVLDTLRTRAQSSAEPAEVVLLRAMQLAHLGETDQALEALAPLTAIGSVEAWRTQALYYSGWVCALDGRTEAACSHLDAVIADYPTSSAAGKARELRQRLVPAVER